MYNRYSRRLFAYCKHQSRLEEHSQNAFQEAWIALFDNCMAKKKIENVSAFLISVARRRIIDYKRKDSRFPQFTPITDIIEENYADISAISDNSDISIIISKALNDLKEDLREAFIMKRINNLEYKEMADITGLTPDCLKKRVYRAEEILRKILKTNLSSE